MNAQAAEKKMSGGVAAERPVLVRSARALSKEDMVLMRLPERFWNATYDGIAEGKHKKIIQRYIQRIHEAMSRGFGLVLWGPNGSGKTSAAVVCAKQARRHSYTVFFVRAAELLKADVNKTYFDAARTKTVYERATEVDLLIVDDLGKEGHPGTGYMAGYATDMFEDLVRARSSRLRATIFTTNMTTADLTKADGLYKKSMGHVLKASSLAVKVEGTDFRKEEVDDLTKALLEED